MHGPIAKQVEGGLADADRLKPSGLRSRWRWIILIVGAIGAVGYITPFVVSRWTHVYIDDARVAANMILVSSEVSGRVVAMPVIPGDAVRRADVLLTIDREQAEWQEKAVSAQIVAIEAQTEQLRAQQRMIQEQVASKVQAAQANIAAAEAALGATQVALDNSRTRFERAEKLHDRGVATQQSLDELTAELRGAEQRKRAAESTVDNARANFAASQAEGAQIGVLDRQIAVLDAQRTALMADKAQRGIDLSRRDIRAGFDGVVGATFVDPGEYVSPGTRLLIYHDPNSVWVEANVKETDFRRVKNGASATITVDAYPGKVFSGKVIRRGEAATSQFALLPSPNPSGSFTKVTQRLPIRISIQQEDNMLRPGMMVEVIVDVID